jgi:phosphatidylserine/phosphatidylglycerophosphate/cardiolipin synthase-like enzyme
MAVAAIFLSFATQVVNIGIGGSVQKADDLTSVRSAEIQIEQVRYDGENITGTVQNTGKTTLQNITATAVGNPINQTNITQRLPPRDITRFQITDVDNATQIQTTSQNPTATDNQEITEQTTTTQVQQLAPPNNGDGGNNVEDITIVETSMQGLPEASGMSQTADVWENSFQSADDSIYIEAPYIENDSEQEFRQIYHAINDSVRNDGVELRIITKDFDSDLNYLVEPENAKLIESSAIETHGKYWIVDKDEAFVGSANWASSAVLTNRELGIFTDNDKVAKTYTKAFSQGYDELGGEPVGGKITEFSNLNPIGSGEQTQGFDNHISSLTSLIESSESELDIFVYQIDDEYWVEELENSIVSAAGNEVDVDILVDGREFAHTGLDNLTRIAENNANIDAKGIENAPHFAHQKNVIVDGERYYIGSANFRTTSMFENRELGATINDQATAQTLESSFNDYYTSDFAVSLTETGFTNLVANPSFEDGNGFNALDWSQADTFGTFEDAAERNSDVSFDGEFSVEQVDLTGSYGRSITSNTVPVAEGREYEFGAYYFLEQTSANPSDATHFVQVNWLDENGDEIASDPGSGTAFEQFDSWTEVSHTREAPSGAAFAQLQIRSRESVNENAHVHWDQAFIKGPNGENSDAFFITQEGIVKCPSTRRHVCTKRKNIHSRRQPKRR